MFLLAPLVLLLRLFLGFFAGTQSYDASCAEISLTGQF
jgi:hypothetical protein